jgi:hypothetical protein
MLQQGQCVPLLDTPFLSIVKRVFELIPADVCKESDEFTERNELLTAYYSFLDVSRGGML